MKKILLLISIVLCSLLSHAQQKWAVSGDVFYGTFSMKSLKSILHTSLSSQFEMRVTEDFPAYVGYTGQLYFIPKQRMRWGVRYQYTSTGGRADYGDYSGRMTQDMLLHASSIGISLQYPLIKSGSNWNLYGSLSAGMAFTELETRYRYVLLDTEYSFSSNYKSLNYFGNPALQMERRIIEWINLYVSAGYEFQIHGELTARDGARKLTYGPDKVTAQWDGFRLALGVIAKI